MQNRRQWLSMGVVLAGAGVLSACKPEEKASSKSVDSSSASSNGANSGGAGAAFAEGVDYMRLSDPMVVPQAEGTVRIDEFFWYACPHCYAFKLAFEPWLAKNNTVKMAKHAVPLGPGWVPMSRTYYTMMSLGGFDQGLHTAFFESFHKERKNINELSETVKVVARVKGDEYAKRFEEKYQSDEISELVNKTRGMADKLKINSTPTLIVAGKYMVNGETAKTNERMVQIIEFLVQKELKEVKSSKSIGSKERDDKSDWMSPDSKK